MKAKYDGKEIELTKDMIISIKALIASEIIMMRQLDKHTPGYKCWYCGCAEIGDMASCGWLSLTFGSKDDAEWIKKSGGIYQTVPFPQGSTAVIKKRGRPRKTPAQQVWNKDITYF